MVHVKDPLSDRLRQDRNDAAACIGEAPEQRCWCARIGGGGGEKGAGQGEPGRAPQGPDTAPGNLVTGARLGTAGVVCLRVITRGRSPVRSCRTPGSVRGVLGNRHPYRDPPANPVLEQECQDSTAKTAQPRQHNQDIKAQAYRHTGIQAKTTTPRHKDQDTQAKTARPLPHSTPASPAADHTGVGARGAGGGGGA